MAGELQVTNTTGTNMYALIRNENGLIWNGSTFVSYVTANLATYAVTLTEQGTASGYYIGTFPTVTLGLYNVVAYQRAGGSPAEGDTVKGAATVYWEGVRQINFVQQAADIADSVDDVSPAAGSFKGTTALSSSNNFYVGSVLAFTSGTLKGVARKITSYTGSTRQLGFTSAFPTAPADDDTFFIIGRIE
jgi:hypothetical protein